MRGTFTRSITSSRQGELQDNHPNSARNPSWVRSHMKSCYFSSLLGNLTNRTTRRKPSRFKQKVLRGIRVRRQWAWRRSTAIHLSSSFQIWCASLRRLFGKGQAKLNAFWTRLWHVTTCYKILLYVLYNMLYYTYLHITYYT